MVYRRSGFRSRSRRTRRPIARKAKARRYARRTYRRRAPTAYRVSARRYKKFTRRAKKRSNNLFPNTKIVHLKYKGNLTTAIPYFSDAPQVIGNGRIRATNPYDPNVMTGSDQYLNHTTDMNSFFQKVYTSYKVLTTKVTWVFRQLSSKEATYSGGETKTMTDWVEQMKFPVFRMGVIGDNDGTFETLQDYWDTDRYPDSKSMVFQFGLEPTVRSITMEYSSKMMAEKSETDNWIVCGNPPVANQYYYTPWFMRTDPEPAAGAMYHKLHVDIFVDMTVKFKDPKNVMELSTGTDAIPGLLTYNVTV